MNTQYGIQQPAIRTIQRDHLADMATLAALTKPDLLTKFALLSTYQPENTAFDLYGTPTVDGPELEAICLHGTTVNLYEALNQHLISSAEAHLEWEWLAAKEENVTNCAIDAHEDHIQRQYDIGVQV